jgi:hypothetical protein
MLAIWITHWNCIKQQKEWSDRAAYNMYETIIKPTIDRFPLQKTKKQRNGWILLLSLGTDRGKPVEPSVWKMCKCYQCQNKEDLPDGRPITDFVLLSPFQIIFDPQLFGRTRFNRMLAPVRDIAVLMSIMVPKERLQNDQIQ